MTPATFIATRKALGYTQKSLAFHLDVSRRTVQAWEAQGPSRLAALWIEMEYKDALAMFRIGKQPAW